VTGEGKLTDYRFGTKTGHHQFCQNCGVQPFGHGCLDVLGGDFCSINLACLDDLDPSELADALSATSTAATTTGSRRRPRPGTFDVWAYVSLY
jgi:hypothetical protein